MQPYSQETPTIVQIMIDIVANIGELQRTQLREWADQINENNESEAVLLASEVVRAAFSTMKQSAPLAV